MTIQHTHILSALDRTRPSSTRQLAAQLRIRVPDAFDLLCDLRRWGLVVMDGEGWVRTEREVTP